MNSSPSARPNLLPTAALVSLLVLLLGATGLFVLSYSNAKSSAALERLEWLHAAQVAVVKSQVNFKTQVQEWKNILLRGNNAKDYAAYLARFGERESDVQAGLVALQTQLAHLGLDATAATRLATEHTALGAAYRKALAAYRPTDATSGFTVDASIRGIDRKFNDDLDALAHIVELAGDADLAAFRNDAASRYTTLRKVTLSFGALAVLAAFWLVFQAAHTPAISPRAA